MNKQFNMSSKSYKTKAFIYVRRSQDRKDRQALSIEGQRQEISKLIEQHDLAPILLPPEERSAHSLGRPLFDDMMKRIEAGEASVIVAWSANRLARNALDGGRIIHYLSTGKITRIITPGRVYKPGMEDEFLLQIEFGMSKMYSDEISKNVLRGYQAKYERGEYPTHAPIGYINVKVGEHRNIAPDPVRADKVVNVFERAATGLFTLDELHRCAFEKECLTNTKNSPIPKQTLSDLLQNTVYYGVYWHGGALRVGRYKSLITKDLFDKVQVAMGWKKGGGSGRNSTSGTYYPYKGVVTCSNCGHNLTAYTKPKDLANGKTAYYTYYACTRKSKKKLKCKEPQITGALLESQLISLIKPIRISEQDAAHCIQLLRKFHKELTENRTIKLTGWRHEQKTIEQKQARLLTMRMDEEITREQFAALKTPLDDQLVRTKELINAAHTDANDWLELAEEFFSSAVTLVDTFQMANDEEKRQLLLELGSNWKMSNKKVRFTPRKPYDLLVNRTETTDWRARPDSNRRSPP